MLKISPKFTAGFCPHDVDCQAGLSTDQATNSYLELFH